MKLKSRLKIILAALGMLVLILDSPTALAGAGEGVELCLRTVIPSLFPFFVLSSVLTNTFNGHHPRWLQSVGRILGIPMGAESILLVGFLGGYPIGAASIAKAAQQGRLDNRDGARMIAFCNNPGPAFIFGIAGSMFDHPWTGGALWAIQIAAALSAGALLPGKSNQRASAGTSSDQSLTQSINASIRSMAGVCGWVILFRVVLRFLDRWFLWLVSPVLRVIICGLLELTNGCCLLGDIRNPGFRFIICSGLLSFGGLCVAMQTTSAAQCIPMQWYFPGKILQCILSMIIALTVCEIFPGVPGLGISPAVLPGLFILAGLLLYFRGIAEKRSGISRKVGV